MSEILKASTAKRLADSAGAPDYSMNMDPFADEIQRKSRAGLYSCRVLMMISDVPKYEAQAQALRDLGYSVDFSPPAGFVDGRTAMNISWED